MTEIGTLQGEEILLKETKEEGVTIKDNIFGKPMQLKNFLHEHLSNLLSCKWMSKGNEATIFCKSINHHNYSAIDMGE